MKHLFLAILLWTVTFPVLAEGKGGEPSPRQLHQQFMGYAQEYHDEAEKLNRKAAITKDSREAGLLRQLAGLNRRLAGLKERMAAGFLNSDENAIQQAEAAYHKLSAEKEALWKSAQGK